MYHEDQIHSEAKYTQVQMNRFKPKSKINYQCSTSKIMAVVMQSHESRNHNSAEIALAMKEYNQVKAGGHHKIQHEVNQRKSRN